MAGKSNSDDELARTATAGAGASPTPTLGATLGRYRLERELGAGGMGVVHAAFDPDLERRVAIKVLLTTGSDEARQRLLREARAMARLTHTNVVTVHEVGSEGGRDYVAMELIDGETLADWLRSTQRSEHEIVAAFMAAGRGLAAAHAADLVHRDFKPHNVLRRRDGRIAVTDFGLARGVENVEARALEETAPVGATTPNTPSSLSGLTATGSVLGTPAYMAPEQWSGGTVGPPADQFAFCVALWEALTGDRPYRGTTLEALKAEVNAGPAKLDASKLPRRLRSVILRGLDPDPAKRWPSMDALLSAIGRAERRPAIALTIVAGVVVAGAAFYVALGREEHGPSCEPEHDLAAVWSPALRKMVDVPDKIGVAAVFDGDAVQWKAARVRACIAAPELRAEQMACLDGVLARFDALRKTTTSVQGTVLAGQIASALVDPAVCLTNKPPRLTVRSTPEVVAALVADVLAERDQLMPEAAVGGTDPCARAFVMLARFQASRDPTLDREVTREASSEADRCGDDRLRADTAITAAPTQYEHPIIGPNGEAAIKHAADMVERVPQDDLLARIDLLRATVASQHEHWDAALKLVDDAIAKFGARGGTHDQLSAVRTGIEVRFNRLAPGDLEAVRELVRTWLPRAKAAHAVRGIAGLEIADGTAQFYLGDVAAGHAAMQHAWEELRRDAPQLNGGKQPIEGEVVDTTGKAVAGAKVVVTRLAIVDSIDIVFPIIAPETIRTVTTDPQGHFAIPDAPEYGAVMAQLDRQRSLPEQISAHVHLVLAPTRHITGTVELGTASPSKITVFVMTKDRPTPYFQLITSVGRDGSFVIDGAPSVAIQMGASVGSFMTMNANVMTHLVPAGTAPISDVKLSVTHSSRQLSVLIRSSLSAPIEHARAMLIGGKIQSKTVGELMDKKIGNGAIQEQFAHPINGELPKTLIDRYRAGDLVSEFDNVASGEISACALPLPGDVYDPKVNKQMTEHIRELEIRCVVVPPNVSVITIETPPQKRLD